MKMEIKKIYKSFLIFIVTAVVAFYCLSLHQVLSCPLQTETLDISGIKVSGTGFTESNVLIIGEGTNRKYLKEKHILINSLPTEQSNPDTVNIDEVSTLEMLKMINNEDQKVAVCVSKHLEQIAVAVDAISEKFAAGGRIVYVGAGTSGRVGFMDSAECPPTFGIPKDRVISLMAGGIDAIATAIENAEDSKESGVNDLKNINFSENDILVGIAASGRTPYVIGAAEYAKSLGSITVSISCNEDLSSPLNSIVHYPIGIYAGPEVITGSTHMKAGTVQKLVLNMISTGVMIKTGKVYNNTMINLQMKNEKLRIRAKKIISEITGAECEEIDKILHQTENNVSLSIFMILTDCEKEKAIQLMDKSNGHLKKVLSLYYSEKV